MVLVYPVYQTCMYVKSEIDNVYVERTENSRKATRVLVCTNKIYSCRRACLILSSLQQKYFICLRHAIYL